MTASQPPLAADATARLARFTSELQFADIPAAALAHLKLLVLDGIACALHGSGLPWTRKVIAMIESQGGHPQAAIFGTGVRTSASQAVLANATAAHAFELDDIHRGAILHAGSLGLPVALALAEWRGGVTGRELIAAIVAGYEVGTRVGMAATQALFFRGFHPQGTTGVFAAGATAARLLGLPPGQTQHALGISGSQAAGLMAAQEGAMAKRLHSGRAAQSGVYAALMAQADFTGIPDVLEAAYGGFLSSYSTDPAPEKLTAGLGSEWEVLNVGFKPHASVTSIHACLDALAALMQDNGLSPDDIELVEAGVAPMTYQHCAWEYKAQSVTAAQMNLYYGLAVMILDGAAFVSQYRKDRLKDPKILDLIGRIEARVDPEIEALGEPHRHAARIVLTTRDGRRLEKLQLQRRGSPDNPLGPDDVEAKFRDLTAERIDKATTERIIATVAALDDLANTDDLVACLRTG